MKKFLTLFAIMTSLSGCAIFNPNCDKATVEDTVYFDFDSSVLKPEAVATIEAQVEDIKNDDNLVLVSGYCDERGTREYNLGLGERRANAVSEYLQTLGVDGDRIETVSYGKDNPVDDGHNEEAWAKNRRATINFVDFE